MFVLLIFLASKTNTILEVHAHNEQWSFVNGGAEVCSILIVDMFPQDYKIGCLNPVKGRYVSLTIGGWSTGFYLQKMTIYSKCKYVCSFKC